MKNITIISFTKKGGDINKRLTDILSESDITSYTLEKYRFDNRVKPLGNLKETVKRHFTDDAVIFIGAVGIAVRSIAPYIKDKFCDPAVLVIDELGRYVIPLLSGHVGGANELANYIGEALSAAPIITTATDINGTFAVDIFAKENNLLISSRKLAKDVSAALLDNNCIDIDSDIKSIDVKELKKKLNPKNKACDIKVRITDRIYDDTVLTLIPKNLYIGVGCKKNTDADKMWDFVNDIFRLEGLDIRAVKSIGSIDIKRDEDAVKNLANRLNVPFLTFTKDELNSASGDFFESEFVRKTVGVGNVCERAVCIQCNNLIVKKTAREGMTVAIGRE
ncbi:cobalamin biosynthesis protein, N-terminal domain protein [Lachnoanaerobaculum saburreum F0468]|uniref:Cobalamin biosynthesis protein, N-terminal domain protein n=1 Tax=Lachnoanaerobaculum saburreum F0468 TaxID=1095750 RepID=I0R5Q6_9FIRM|nr:cobalt-precorrin 5A hydrolase [Lachnoanaerobaculum saburreum]EIC95014.1 cobalamin biosynthesis protein, N-terminal domain protein [Lachnoanaerobaculum saburreum F0468]